MYSNIKGVMNVHIEMTQPDKTKIIPDKLLIYEIIKQINITNRAISDNEGLPTI